MYGLSCHSGLERKVFVYFYHPNSVIKSGIRTQICPISKLKSLLKSDSAIMSSRTALPACVRRPGDGGRLLLTARPATPSFPSPALTVSSLPTGVTRHPYKACKRLTCRLPVSAVVQTHRLY